MDMEVVYRKHFPFKGFTALTMWPVIFVRADRKEKFTYKVLRHETTHALQQIECYVLGWLLALAMILAGFEWWSLVPIGLFFELYLIEWSIKTLFCRFDIDRAYMSISTEQEAYKHEKEVEYNSKRKHFAWVRYIFSLTPKK